MRNRVLITLLILISSCAPGTKVIDGFDTVIYGGRVMDPASGTDNQLNVGITDGVIQLISKDSLRGTTNINASGLVVAPGFIDLHCHGMTNEAFGLMVQDGVTSGFELEVGTDDVSGWYDEHDVPQYVNYGVSVGHIRVRMAVMGDEGEWLPSDAAIENQASDDQIAQMEQMITQGLDEGAIAVGFGLAYTPAATTAEFRTMLQIAADRGASSHIHLRSGIEGVKEAISTAVETGAGLHIVHVNSSGGAQSADFIKRIEAANADGHDITTEAYPYEAGMTRIESSLFDEWKSWDEDRYAIHQWAETGERLNRETFAKYRAQGGGVIIHDRTEEMTLAALSSPLTMIASDGFYSDGRGHPRTAGTFSKILGKYVREKKLYSLMDALRRMTIAPAQRLEKYVSSMARKGRLGAGADADITVFDPTRVIDKATYTEPGLPSEGVEYVLVNGGLVVENGELNDDATFGVAIRNPVSN